MSSCLFSGLVATSCCKMSTDLLQVACYLFLYCMLMSVSKTNQYTKYDEKNEFETLENMFYIVSSRISPMVPVVFLMAFAKYILS